MESESESFLVGAIKTIGVPFAMGFVGSLSYYYIKGRQASPTDSRLSVFRAACLKAPRVGGKVLLWNCIEQLVSLNMEKAGVETNEALEAIVPCMVATAVITEPHRDLARSARITAIVGGALMFVNCIAGLAEEE